MSRRRTTGGVHGKWLLGLLAMAALAALGCNSSGSPTEPAPATSDSEIEFRLFQLVNDARSAAGVQPPLSSDERLAAIAREHSRDMRDLGFLGHTKPDGTTLRQRLETGGVEFSRAAENIAQLTGVTDPATFAHELLMDSEQHRTNILDDRFRRVGIGVARSDNTVWVTQIFIRP